MVALSTLASGSTTATVGTAWSSVHSRNFVPESSRARMPVTTTSSAPITATMPKMPNFRRDTGELCSVGIWRLRYGGGFGALLLVYHTKNHGDKHQRGDGGKDQPADHGASQRRVLFAALAEAERHRRHADNHRQRGHQHRAKTHEPGFDSGGDRIAQFLIAFAGKADHQHAVGGGHAHAHDRA